MRLKSDPQGYLNFVPKSSVNVVEQYRQKYERIAQLLDNNPDLLELAHQDWNELLSTSEEGRGGFTSEHLLRALIVMFVEQDSYRNAVIRIENSEFLRSFIRLGHKSTMDFTFLNRAYSALHPGTVELMTSVLRTYAIAEGLISSEKQRMDTTAYETNIHYPTDSSLLCDSFLTLSRIIRQLDDAYPQLVLKHRFHDKKVKKMAIFIARNASSRKKSTQRAVKRQYVKLIKRVLWIYGVGQQVQAKATQAGYTVPTLEHYLPLVKRIIDQADRRINKGEKVPPDEKLYSLFESHTELIVRGKAGKPIEFGHKILIAQTGEKYIHYYKVMEHQVADKDLLCPAVEAHKDMFGSYPDVLSTDKGFYESMAQLKSLEENIEVVSIAKKGRRTQQEEARETTDAFIEGQHFRAGSEGTISVLKRAFKLGKCYFKGFKNYATSVGFAVLCHNLVLLTRL
jgi:IS5 family transposase